MLLNTKFKFIATLFSLVALSCNHNSDYTTQNVCDSSITLPSSYTLINENNALNKDYCDFIVDTKDKYIDFYLSALILGRFNISSLSDAYNNAIIQCNLDISSTKKSSNHFVITGRDKITGNIIHWKRIIGDRYVSDLRIEYDSEKHLELASEVSFIVDSFSDITLQSQSK